MKDLVESCWIKIYNQKKKEQELKDKVHKKTWDYYVLNKDNIKKIIATERPFSYINKDLIIKGKVDLLMKNHDELFAYTFEDNKKIAFETNQKILDETRKLLINICDKIKKEKFEAKKNAFCRECIFDFCCKIGGKKNEKKAN